ncbi:hypothetical protein HMPREF3039_01322 [Akkermansia sp. KLE1798]|nr:hypothetical protein HMPREF3039_01322 [Akkermansia sp. KLE1798]KZA04822.1 hypothetical protein HMPREF1326_01399 [Akkermansia sp. KLE1605]
MITDNKPHKQSSAKAAHSKSAVNQKFLRKNDFLCKKRTRTFINNGRHTSNRFSYYLLTM